jgi:hypothetical protein
MTSIEARSRVSRVLSDNERRLAMANPLNIQYSLQETVDGYTTTYDAGGNATRSFTPKSQGPNSKLRFRKHGEPEKPIQIVDRHAYPDVKIVVPGCIYLIDTRVQKWRRYGACTDVNGAPVTDLEIKEDVDTDWLPVQWVLDQSVEILLHAGSSSCTYTFDRVLQTWVRRC